MASLRVDTSPYTLVWAREAAGLTVEDAAKKIGVSATELRFWEEGASDPTIAQARRMTEVYRRPLAVLLLDRPPRDVLPLRDFRLLPVNRTRSYSAPLRAAFRRVEMQREVAAELAELADDLPLPLDLDLHPDEDAEAAGAAIRAWLDLPAPDNSARSPDPLAHLNQLIGQVEAKGILVTQADRVALEEMRGCSISEIPFPAVIINGADAPRGKVFTLLHELAHILLRAGGVCDLDDRARHLGTDTQRIERFCNQAAAATLMPRDVLFRYAVVAKASPATTWTDAALTQLADRFGVSREATLLRLVNSAAPRGRRPWRGGQRCSRRMKRRNWQRRGGPDGRGITD